MRLLLVLFLALQATTLTALPHTAQARELVMVFGSSYEPFYHTNSQTNGAVVTGMFADLLDAFEDEHPSFSIRRVFLPRVRMDRWMETGRAQLFALSSPFFLPHGRRDDFIYTQAIWTTGDHVVVTPESDIEDPRPEALVGKRLGVIRGNGYGPFDDYFEKGLIKDERANSMHHLYRMLQRGRVDAIIDNRHVGPYNLIKNGYDLDRFVFLTPAVYEFDLMTEARPEAADFIAAFDAFIGRAKENGLLEELWRRYVNP